MFLFILESIGTSELIFIGIIALIFLGPRKLPQIARTIGKTMADFRNTTNEFKETWQREVEFDTEINALRTGDIDEPAPVTVPRIDTTPDGTANSIAPPEIKAVNTDMFADIPRENKPEAETQDQLASDDHLSDKRNWL